MGDPSLWQEMEALPAIGTSNSGCRFDRIDAVIGAAVLLAWELGPSQ
jgi:hypothetical protein